MYCIDICNVSYSSCVFCLCVRQWFLYLFFHNTAFSAHLFCKFFSHSLVCQSILPTLVLHVYQSESFWNVWHPQNSIHTPGLLVSFLQMSAINLCWVRHHCMCCIHITQQMLAAFFRRVKVLKQGDRAVKWMSERQESTLDGRTTRVFNQPDGFGLWEATGEQRRHVNIRHKSSAAGNNQIAISNDYLS